MEEISLDDIEKNENVNAEEQQAQASPEAKEALKATGAAPQGAYQKEPEAIINKVARHFRLSNLIYLLGVIQMAGGAVLGVVLFFVSLAGSRGYGYYYYGIPRFSGIFSSLLAGLFIFLAFVVSGAMTMGFGKLVQAAEIYIQRRSRKA